MSRSASGAGRKLSPRGSGAAGAAAAAAATGTAGAGTGAGAGAGAGAGTGAGSGTGAHAPGEVGIAESFDSLRTTAEQLLAKSQEVEAQLKSAVLPPLETLRGDIEKHYKGLKGPGLKGQKDVDKSRTSTQKYVDALFQSVSGSSRTEAKTDPYVLKRQAMGAASDQILAENAHAEAVLSSQNNFQTLERHIVQVLQQAVSVLEQILGGFAGSQAEAYKGVLDTFRSIDRDHEWNNFMESHRDRLVTAESARRDPQDVTFTNADHSATVPLMEGILQRKGTVMKQWSSSYYVLTPAGYLHEYKSADATHHPAPELSIYLPGSLLSPLAEPVAADGKFTFQIHGKDAGKAIGTKHKYVFRTGTQEELRAWHDALTMAATGASPETAEPTLAGAAAGGGAAGAGMAEAGAETAAGQAGAAPGTDAAGPGTEAMASGAPGGVPAQEQSHGIQGGYTPPDEPIAQSRAQQETLPESTYVASSAPLADAGTQEPLPAHNEQHVPGVVQVPFHQVRVEGQEVPRAHEPSQAQAQAQPQADTGFGEQRQTFNAPRDVFPEETIR